MNRLDRALGILLWLRSGKAYSAAELAKRFAVSPRTIYRDIELLSAIGVPVYAEMGREGGFRLLEGYFLPPLMFSLQEAVALLFGLTWLQSGRTKPLAAEVESVEQKLLAAVPEHMRSVLARAQALIGFERTPVDVFHPEAPHQGVAAGKSVEEVVLQENDVIRRFLQAILEQKSVIIHYQSPYRAPPERFSLIPCGLLWDRDRWYLVGKRPAQATVRFWRADRVLTLQTRSTCAEAVPAFDIQDWLDRRWLAAAMAQWREESPVVIRLTRTQADRLHQDWYYRHAYYEEIDDNGVQMTFGEDECANVMALLRWLGPGAELVEPKAWRSTVQAELRQMLACYEAI